MSTEATAPPEKKGPTPSLLPSKKSAPTLSLENAKGFLFGPPKIGKTTLGVNFAEEALILACEPGVGALSSYSVEVTSWERFREIGSELAENPDRFPVVVIDTVDVLYRYCTEYVCKQHGVNHPGDVEFGKVWNALDQEFQNRIGKLAALGRGVWFISHSKEVEIKKRVGTITMTVPTLRPQAMRFINEFCDFIVFATSELGEDGERRVLRTAAAENYMAGGRLPLTDPLPLDADALRADIERAVKGGAK